MTETFADIEIKCHDKAESGPSSADALSRIVLRLSQIAPASWAECFSLVWRKHSYIGKCQAAVSGDMLEVICMLEDLEKVHLPELQQTVAKTNSTYKEYAAALEWLTQAQEEAAKRPKCDLLDRLLQLGFE